MAGNVHRHIAGCGDQLRLFGRALLRVAQLLTQPAARAEAAARWRRDRRWDLALKNEAILDVVRLHLWNGGDECHRVRMLRLGEDSVYRPDLNDLAQIHHSDAIREVAHDIKVVADEEVGQPLLVPQIGEQVQYLALNGNVER